MTIRLKLYYTGMGSNVFINKLKNYLVSNLPVKIVDKDEDIYLSSVWEGPGKSKKAIWIHRADGVYFDLDHSGHTGMNKRIQRVINKSHAVIFQSKYSKKICKGILKVNKSNSRIIHNGCDPDIYKEINVDKMGYSKMLVASAKWRPLKRPKSIAKGFAKVKLDDTVLVMIGEVEKKYRITHPHIKYVGKIKSNETRKYYASCDGVIHISMLVACSNMVVEALCAGKPVLGKYVVVTPELIKNVSVIINIEPKYN